MSRIEKLSHTLLRCQYHIIWVPKYRHKILAGQIVNEVGNYIKAFLDQKHIKILEMNVQPEHIHLVTMIPLKISVSDYCGMVKGRTAILVFKKYKELRQRSS